MLKYRYIKKFPFRLFGKNPSYFLKPFSLFFSFLGLVLVGNAVAPVVLYQLRLSPKFKNEEILSPLSSNLSLNRFSQLNQVLGEKNTSDELADPRNWFPEAPFSPFIKGEISTYRLSIPKLKIFEASVKVGVEDLNKNVVQYPGTGVPGRPGNVVIFGHSVLPHFFNPKNYKTIFSTLPTLTKGVEVLLDYDEVRYTYLVEELTEVFPNDISILAQKNDDAFVTLVTCVPPGTYLKRLIVRARLAR